MLGVGMERRIENTLGWRLLSNAACVHDHYPVGNVGMHSHIMGHQQNRIAAHGLDILNHLQHATLYDDIQCSGGLIRNNQTGLEQGRQGDCYPLSHATRKLVRVGVEDFGRQTQKVDMGGYLFPGISSYR